GLALGGGEAAGGEEPLVGGLGGVIVAHAFAADPAAGDQLAKRPEEVHLHAHELVEALQEVVGGAGGVAVAAHEPPDNEPVAEFHPGLIILAIVAAARDVDAVAATVCDEAVIEELAPIVGVPFAQGDRQALPEAGDAAADPLGSDAPHGFQLDPATRHVDGHEAAQIEPFGRFATVQHQIALHRARASAPPVPPGPNRDLLLERVGRRGGPPGCDSAGAADRWWPG